MNKQQQTAKYCQYQGQPGYDCAACGCCDVADIASTIQRQTAEIACSTCKGISCNDCQAGKYCPYHDDGISDTTQPQQQ